MYREEDNRYKSLLGFGEAYDRVAVLESPDIIDQDELSETELKQHNRNMDFCSDIRKAVKIISDAVNRESPKTVGEIMAMELINQHRTLQACTVKAVLSMLEVYQGASYDLRNKAAVEVAEKISNMEDMYIPFI